MTSAMTERTISASSHRPRWQMKSLHAPDFENPTPKNWVIFIGKFVLMRVWWELVALKNIERPYWASFKRD